jgi:hypothetical protein
MAPGGARQKIGCLFLCLVSGSSSLAQTATWPNIQPLHDSHTFIEPGRGKDTPFLALIKNASGSPVYKVECHNGNYDDESEINFSEDFQCALFGVSGGKGTTGNLLAVNNKDEQSTDWWNRGRMLSHQLRGECLAYPEYSTLRHFKIRGMLVTLRFTNVEWSSAKDQQGNPLLEKFTVTIDVVPDGTALSSTAEPAAGPEPPRSCYP